MKPDPETHKTQGDKHTNTIENFWSTFKRWYIGIYHYMSPKHLNRYTNEFGYRYNNREDKAVDKFKHVVKNSGKVRLKYEKLIGRTTSQTLDQLAEIHIKNPPAHPDSWMDNIDTDSVPVVE